jgi:hypothetical protein
MISDPFEVVVADYCLIYGNASNETLPSFLRAIAK